MVDAPSGTAWWEEVRLQTGQTGRWCIAGLEVAVYRDEREWLIATREVGGQDEMDWTFERLDGRPEETEDIQRHAFRRTGERVWLRPVLADRSVVTSPRIPLYVPPGEETTLYVGSPLWLRVETGDPAVALHEAPIRRPSDTWFGPNTREGELCYATRTRAALDVTGLPASTRRALTALRIRNRSEGPLPVEKVRLPVPYLSVFHAPASGLLWTQAVTLAHEEGLAMANLDIHDAPPRDAGETKLLTEPRERPAGRLLLRAFGTLFG